MKKVRSIVSKIKPKSKLKQVQLQIKEDLLEKVEAHLKYAEKVTGSSLTLSSILNEVLNDYISSVSPEEFVRSD